MNCPKCGAQIADNATICGFCGQIISQAPADQQSNQAGPDLKPQKKENVVMGVVGVDGCLGYKKTICVCRRICIGATTECGGAFGFSSAGVGIVADG